MWVGSGVRAQCASANEELGTLADNTALTTRDQNSIADIGLVAGGKERKEGKKIIFFILFDLFNIDADGAKSIADITKTRKAQYQTF